MAIPKETIQQAQQKIRSAIQNFDWETNPHWAEQWAYISGFISRYWKDHLKR